MAISETTLKDTVLMLVAEQNAKGGLLGCQLEAVVVDPASDWPLFAEKARELVTVKRSRRDLRQLDLGQPQVGAAGDRGTERPAVLPRAVRGRGKLAQRVLHRRRAEPAGDPGGRLLPRRTGRQKFALLGTDYVYPRTTNNILEAT
jgi:urea transport system substrate-binding protein